jgi:hypothetical protein
MLLTEQVGTDGDIHCLRPKQSTAIEWRRKCLRLKHSTAIEVTPEMPSPEAIDSNGGDAGNAFARINRKR